MLAPQEKKQFLRILGTPTGISDSSNPQTMVALFWPGLCCAIRPRRYESECYVGDTVKVTNPKTEAAYGQVIEEECLNEGCLSSREHLCGMRCLFIMILDEELA